MSDKKKIDSAVENAEKTALTGEKSANKHDKDARELSQDELDAVSGAGSCSESKAFICRGVLYSGVHK